MTESNPAHREFLRHTVATVAYRGAKALRDAPDDFADFRVSPTTRTPVEILAHIGDLYDWALSIVSGRPAWQDSAPLSWTDEKARFFAALRAFDDFLASDAVIEKDLRRVFQGAIADSLTHIGQIGLLRGVFGNPVAAENYYRAAIVAGGLDPE